MNRKLIVSLFWVLCISCAVFTQVPVDVHVRILKSEDSRRYGVELEKLITGNSPEPILVRAMLAAGRIGDERAVPALTQRLNSASPKVAETAAFALGEIESISAADAISASLVASGGDARAGRMPAVQSRLVEAAGKIAAANAKDPKANQLSDAIVSVLAAEKERPTSVETIRLALTAALRARPAGADENIRFFLSHTDPGVVADALNTLARLRAKNANRDARDLLETHTHAVVRANAARVLGAAEDKEAVDLLIKAATSDVDSRVRVSAIRSLASLKDQKAAGKLIERGIVLLKDIQLRPGTTVPWYGQKPRQNQPQRNELIEIATAVARLLPNSDNEAAVDFLLQLGKTDRYVTSEVLVALATVSPKALSKIRHEDTACYGIGVMPGCDRYSRNRFLALAEFAKFPPENDFHKKALNDLEIQLERMSESVSGSIDDQSSRIGALEAYGAFKDAKPEFIIPFLKLKYGYAWDPFIRAAAAGILAQLPESRINFTVLSEAFAWSLANEKHDNDAQLAMLDAMAKIDKATALDTIYLALDAPDYLVRKKALELLNDAELVSKYPGVVSVVQSVRAQNKHLVLPYNAKTGTKLGQVLNKDADYRRAVSRKNGRVKAVLTTEKGTFTIDLLPEDAPLTVDNFVKLARSGYFNGLEVHRVVPNFVMQDGDPRGDGNGGPGWSIRCEINMVPYERGAVGMALSGKDTGGSQWFVTHSPQPHLDGGYTVFGRVNEKDMAVVDKIVRGDKIISVRVVEGAAAPRAARRR